MRDSKLVQSILGLSAWEQRHFRDFVNSPFFNKHGKVRQLVDLLLEQLGDSTVFELGKEEVFTSIFPGTPYHEQKFKDLLSLTMKQFRSFLAFHTLKNSEFRTGMALLEAYRERLQEKPFETQQKALLKSVGRSKEKLQEVHLRRLELHESLLTYQSISMGRSVDNMVQVASDQLDVYFLLSKLKYGVEMSNRRQVVAQEFDPGLLETVISYIEAHPELQDRHPEIRIYLLIYQCQDMTFSGETFQVLIRVLQESASDFPQTEVREMYAYVNNLCIRQINQGNREYLPVLLDLYKWALGHGALLSVDGWLVEWDYKNIVSASLRVGEVEWCRQFIEEFKERIAPESRENAYTYNLASFHFEQQDYGRALRMLQEVEFSDVFYVLGSKVILLKAYFETEDFEALSHLCDSFRIYLKRNKTLSERQASIYFNLIRFARKLADLRKKYSLIPKDGFRQRLDSIAAQSQEVGNIAQGTWLQQKISELKSTS